MEKLKWMYIFLQTKNFLLPVDKLSYILFFFWRFKKEENIWVEDRERSVLQAVAASGQFFSMNS
jgi:hypothetical protein